MDNQSKKGLADKEARERVAGESKKAAHEQDDLLNIDEQLFGIDDMSMEEMEEPAPPQSKRGLASADPETRRRVASAGGRAPHEVRGFQAMDEETQRAIASAGGRAPHEKRGLQAADEETRHRVASEGGRA